MRDAFLLDPDLVFLNHGSFGACPREVLEVCQGWQQEMERNPVDFLARRSGALLAEARRALAEHLGASPEDLLFLPNTTHGVNLVARSVDLGPGAEVLATDHEYGACDAAWEAVCRRSGATYVRVPVPLPFRPESFAERIEAAVTPRTRMIFLSHITSSTALLFPVEEVCRRARRAGIPVFIDGAHGPGQLALDLATLGADYYAGNCHKWLCAPKGTAFLHARPERQTRLEPLVVSWGSELATVGNPAFEAYTGRTALQRPHQWQGTRDLSAFLSIPAAIAFQARHGWAALRARCHELAVGFLARMETLTGLEPIAPEASFLQMVPVPLPPVDGEALRDALFHRYHIEAPVTSFAGRALLRVSVQAYNTPQDLDRLAEALAILLAHHR